MATASSVEDHTLSEQDADVLIIGGGLAGLSCAVGLAGAGLRIVVLESSPTWGGRAGSGTDARTGDRIDLGPHVILTEYPNFLWLLKALGTESDIVWQRNKLITLVNARQATTIRSWPLPAPLHLFPGMLTERNLSLRDKLSNVSALWLGMRFQEQDVRYFDAIPASRLLRSLNVSQAFTDWFWRSAAMCLLNVPLERCSAGALMRLFAQIIGRADARFGFPAGALDELFVPGARRVIEANGGQLRESCPVISLTHADSACTGALLGQGERISARYCVAALPPAELQRILPDSWKRAPAFEPLDRFAPSPYISVHLWFDRKLTREQSWARTWTPEGLNYDFYDLSNIRSGWQERNSVIASNVIYSHRAEPLTDDEIVERTLRELGEFIPNATRCNPVHHRVQRIPMAIPCPIPGSETARPPTTSGFAGLLLAGDWTRTTLPSSMESAVRSGLLAAEQILKEIGVPRALAQLPRPPGGIAGLVQRLEQSRPPLPVPA
jgi:squalene-associated FAD-dependent desaturase